MTCVELTQLAVLLAKAAEEIRRQESDETGMLDNLLRSFRFIHAWALEEFPSLGE